MNEIVSKAPRYRLGVLRLQSGALALLSLEQNPSSFFRNRVNTRPPKSEWVLKLQAQYNERLDKADKLLAEQKDQGALRKRIGGWRASRSTRAVTGTPSRPCMAAVTSERRTQ